MSWQILATGENDLNHHILQSSQKTHKQICDDPSAEVLLDRPAEELQDHNIRKIIKKSSVSYFCNECNTHYARLAWVMEDHPNFDANNFNVWRSEY